MIECRHLSKRYGGRTAVDDLSFDVRSGVVTGFLGPNGAGKSTTLRLMLDLAVGGGQTRFDGHRFADLADPIRRVGAVLEARDFHPGRTARRHLRMLAAGGGVRATGSTRSWRRSGWPTWATVARAGSRSEWANASAWPPRCSATRTR